MSENSEEIQNSQNADENNNNDTPPAVEENAPNKEQDQKQDNTVSDLFNAPETYDYKDVVMPKDMKLDDEIINKFNPIAKELNLSQKGADKLMTLAVELVQRRTADFQNFAKETLNTTIAKYEQMLNDDKEIGGNKLDESLRVANVAYEAFADDEVKSLFEQTGLNKHPAMVKMFLKFGKLCQDDKLHLGSNPPKERTAADWYPDMVKNNA